jgi:hypothetical protein
MRPARRRSGWRRDGPSLSSIRVDLSRNTVTVLRPAGLTTPSIDRHLAVPRQAADPSLSESIRVFQTVWPYLSLRAGSHVCRIIARPLRGLISSLCIHGPDRTDELIHYAIDDSPLTLRVGPQLARAPQGRGTNRVFDP